MSSVSIDVGGGLPASNRAGGTAWASGYAAVPALPQKQEGWTEGGQTAGLGASRGGSGGGGTLLLHHQFVYEYMYTVTCMCAQTCVHIHVCKVQHKPHPC